MIRKIEIMDYSDKKKKIVIKNFENVVKLKIHIVSGDEILEVLYKDYSFEVFDSSNCRFIDYPDDEYILYDITQNINFINSWSKRKDSYNYELINKEV